MHISAGVYVQMLHIYKSRSERTSKSYGKASTKLTTYRLNLSVLQSHVPP